MMDSTNLNNPKSSVNFGSKHGEGEQGTSFKTQKWNSESGPKTQRREERSNKAEKLTPTSIEIYPVGFEGTMESTILTTFEIVDMLEGVFRPAISDFVKARFFPDQKGGLNAHLIFSPTDFGDSKLHVLKAKGSGNSGSSGMISSTIQKWNSSISSTSRFEMTQEGKEALAPYIPENYRISSAFDDSYNPPLPRINWKAVLREEGVPSGYGFGATQRIMYVIPINIYTFFKKFWGHVNDEGNPVFYNIEPFAPMGNMVVMGLPNPYGVKQNIQDTAWAFRLERCDEHYLEGIKRKLGFNQY